MTEKQKNYFSVIAMLCILFVGSVGIGFLLTEIAAGNYNYSEESIAATNMKPTEARTYSWQERYALCTLYDLDCEAQELNVAESVQTQIATYTFRELAEIYPLPEWTVEENENTITITHNIEGLCKKHQAILHLSGSENGQYVAVYYGPSAVGNSAGTFLVTDVPLNRLSREQLDALNAGVYEYYSQEELIAVLDNFSEL